MSKLVYHTPEIFTEQYSRSFLDSVEPIFRLTKKEVPNFLFDLSKTRKINILGLLLIYKFLEYTVENDCFKKPICNINDSRYVSGELERYGFKKLVSAFINGVEPNYNLKFKEEDEFFIAPILLDRNSAIASVEGQYAGKINKYYSYDIKASFVALQCLGEISSNFISHAQDDTKSILAAKGNQEYVEIACADTGIGIISSLKPVFLNNMSGFHVLSRSVEKGITSKLKSAHMGYGLWLINEFVSVGKGNLTIFSEGAYFINNAGKVKSGQCSYWKGTIIYIKLMMQNTSCYSAVIDSLKKECDDINLQRI